jgi:hypothetical protein
MRKLLRTTPNYNILQDLTEFDSSLTAAYSTGNISKTKCFVETFSQFNQDQWQHIPQCRVARPLFRGQYGS